MSESPRSRIKRRALAPISSTVEEAESSIQMGASPRLASVRGHFAPVVAVHVPGAELVRVHARLGREQAQQQRLLRHFQAEDRHGLLLAQRDVSRDVQREGRLSHRRARREDDQLGRLQAGGFVVETRIAGGEPGDAAAFAEDFLEALEAVLDQVLDADQSGADAVFGDLENGRFRAVENDVGVVSGGERLLLNRRGGMNQVAQDRLFLDDARVVLDVA